MHWWSAGLFHFAVAISSQLTKPRNLKDSQQ
jgi:hypothetical protein